MTRIRLSNEETSYGTVFKSETQRLMTNKIPKKLFGLGVGVAFIGGAGFGFGAGLASYSIYHRYHYFRSMLHDNGYITDWDEDYYSSYYEQNKCLGGCPANSHCEWSFCECNAGFSKMWGQCSSSTSPPPPPDRHSLDHSALPCSDTAGCRTVDINMVCTNNKCSCKRDMKWNTKAMECQILLDVDCKATTYYSPVSSLVQAALGKTKAGILAQASPNPKSVLDALFSGQDLSASVTDKDKNVIGKPTSKPKDLTIPDDRTQTKNESLSDSLLKYIDAKGASKENLEEAFCRDIDAFSEVFQLDTAAGKPYRCKDVPRQACAILFDSSSCKGGWTLEVTPGTQRRLQYFSSDWKYRNDIDTIGVASGCTFTGFTGSSFDGDQMVVTAGIADKWLVLQNDNAYKKFHEDIESFQCVCRG